MKKYVVIVPLLVILTASPLLAARNTLVEVHDKSDTCIWATVYLYVSKIDRNWEIQSAGWSDKQHVFNARFKRLDGDTIVGIKVMAEFMADDECNGDVIATRSMEFFGDVNLNSRGYINFVAVPYGERGHYGIHKIEIRK